MNAKIRCQVVNVWLRNTIRFKGNIHNLTLIIVYTLMNKSIVLLPAKKYPLHGIFLFRENAGAGLAGTLPEDPIMC